MVGGGRGDERTYCIRVLRDEKGIIVALKDTKRCSTPIDWGCMMVRRQEEGERNLASKGIKSRPSGYFRVFLPGIGVAPK